MNSYFGRSPSVLHWLHRSKTYMVVLFNDMFKKKISYNHRIIGSWNIPSGRGPRRSLSPPADSTQEHPKSNSVSESTVQTPSEL